MMKRKRADRADWRRITKRRFALTHMDTAEFKGYVGLFCIDEVREPLWVKHREKNICMADTGYMWLQHFPQDKHYVITTNFNAQGELIRWYIDICKQHFLDQKGLLWYDDLYLDLDVSPDGEMNLLDVDELDDALRQGIISPLEYDLAWREADGLMAAIEEDMFPLLWSGMWEAHRDRLLKLVKAC